MSVLKLHTSYANGMPNSLDIVEGMLALPGDREYDNTQRIAAGFDENVDVLQAFKETWSLFVRYKILPPF